MKTSPILNARLHELTIDGIHGAIRLHPPVGINEASPGLRFGDQLSFHLINNPGEFTTEVLTLFHQKGRRPTLQSGYTIDNGTWPRPETIDAVAIELLGLIGESGGFRVTKDDTKKSFIRAWIAEAARELS